VSRLVKILTASPNFDHSLSSGQVDGREVFAICSQFVNRLRLWSKKERENHYCQISTPQQAQKLQATHHNKLTCGGGRGRQNCQICKVLLN
jgi:Spy/CpxP family protein refolding chaperone